MDGEQVRVTIISQEGTQGTFVAPNAFHRELSLPPRTAYAWEVSSM